MLLAITYRVPSLQSMQVEGAEAAIKKGYEIMRTWEESPSVGAAVRRFAELIKKIGIDLGDDTEHSRDSRKHPSAFDTNGLVEDRSPYGHTVEMFDT
jgi:hypothetical protein